MKTRIILSIFILAISLMAFGPLVQAADDQNPTVLYQSTFSTDPKWVTNNPSSDYWASDVGMYHFAIEPSTGSYAYVTIPQYERGSFKLEYDLILHELEEGATFRMGFAGTEMDASKGPIVLNLFTNAKNGRIMWLHLVTNGNKQMQVNSKKGDTLTSGPTNYYDGPTVKYELNKTYRVTTTYDAPGRLLTMKVTEKTSGVDIWNYFINTGEDLHGMNRIYLGSKGDYGMMGIFAKGYIDNVRLTVPAAVTETTAVTTTTAEPIKTNPTPLPSAARTAAPVTSAPPVTQESPVSAATPVIAIGIIGVLGLSHLTLRRRE